jgi:predicted DNA-binding protein
MKRTQIQMDEETYRRLKEEAHARGASMAELVREALRAYLGLAPKGKKTLKDFSFIGSGSSKQGDLQPVSECHDEALGAVDLS